MEQRLVAEMDAKLEAAHETIKKEVDTKVYAPVSQGYSYWTAIPARLYSYAYIYVPINSLQERETKTALESQFEEWKHSEKARMQV